MSASLSSRFLEDLARVYATLRPQPFSAGFVSDLAQVYATLPVASDTNLLFLAAQFKKWRRVTQEFVRTHLLELSEDDPLICPISLFRTMDSGRLETAHTRTLAWLLDPTAEHGFRTRLLAALLRHLSGRDCLDQLRVDRVQSECPMDNSGAKGRLDVLAHGVWKNGEPAGWLLAMEAKVDAWEGEDQLKKYETWVRSRAAGREVFLVFLTPGSRPPETADEEWVSLSFLQLVRIFRTVYGELRQAPGFHFLRFYLAGVLQDVCGFPRKVTDNAPDPYAMASYLKTVHESQCGGAKP